LSVAAQGAAAADARVRSRPAPALVSSYDWTGFYLGGHAGAGFSYRDWALAAGATTEAGDAVLLGGQAGFNYQIGKLVAGVEADGSWGNLKDENFCPDGVNTLDPAELACDRHGPDRRDV
jgi:outer membrane immunogenic protein